MPAIQHYVCLRALPLLPNIGMTFTGYVSPAADAAVLMEWLAG